MGGVLVLLSAFFVNISCDKIEYIAFLVLGLSFFLALKPFSFYYELKHECKSTRSFLEA